MHGKFVTTGIYHLPIQINQCVVFARDDMTMTHDEEDTMLIQQVASVGTTNIQINVKVIMADDTSCIWAPM